MAETELAKVKHRVRMRVQRKSPKGKKNSISVLITFEKVILITFMNENIQKKFLRLTFYLEKLFNLNFYEKC